MEFTLANLWTLFFVQNLYLFLLISLFSCLKFLSWGDWFGSNIDWWLLSKLAILQLQVSGLSGRYFTQQALTPLLFSDMNFENVPTHTQIFTLATVIKSPTTKKQPPPKRQLNYGHWRREGLKQEQATGKGERSTGRRELHSERCSCTEAAANGVGRGLSEVIGGGCRCRCFLNFSTWKLARACARVHTYSTTAAWKRKPRYSN